MRKLLVLFLMLCFASWAFAYDLGNVEPQNVDSKGMSHVGKNPGKPDGREGGETIGTAFPIMSLPFVDTGNTCDNIDDYEETCPYGSTSPDVVYSFTPGTNMLIDIDLCGSTYDTKTYVYAGGYTPGAPYACNDDFYYDATCGYYTSFLEAVAVTAGTTYYIVIDGYGGDCGDYLLEVREYEVCDVICNVDAQPEGEPALVPNYVDHYNGGCNSPPANPFQTIHWINADDPDGCAWLCGVSGWYTYSGSNYRDTDWFRGVAAGYEVTMTIEAEFESYIFFLGPTDCTLVDVVSSALASPCTPTTLSYASYPGEEIWMWVGPSTFTGPVNEYEYFLKICGLAYDTIPVENKTWGGVKSIYK
jgi:hypothetical protein